MTQNPLNINMADPQVRRLIEGDGPGAPGARKLEQLHGDKAPPSWSGHGLAGAMSGRNNRGALSNFQLDKSKIEVLVSYRGRFGEFDMTVDVYQLPGEPIELVLICPKCHGGGRGAGSRITSERKKIEFDRDHGRPYTFVDGSRIAYNGGALSVEPFECSFEMNSSEKHVIGQRAGGVNLCRMRMAIDNSIAKDA